MLERDALRLLTKHQTPERVLLPELEIGPHSVVEGVRHAPVHHQVRVVAPAGGSVLLDDLHIPLLCQSLHI